MALQTNRNLRGALIPRKGWVHLIGGGAVIRMNTVYKLTYMLKMLFLQRNAIANKHTMLQVHKMDLASLVRQKTGIALDDDR